MKKIILPGFLTLCIAIASSGALAQKDTAGQKKSREIIIRSNGNKDAKMNIEINGDKVTVNGKPLSDYHNGDVTVIERDRMNRKSDNFLFTPKGEDMEWQGFNDRDNDLVPGAFLGVITEKSTDGVKITSVIKESSAGKAGLKTGDVITKVDKKNISNPDELMEAIRSYKPNDQVTIYYKRDGKQNDMKIKLGENKNSERTFIFKDGNGFGNGNDFNFKMPPMPKMPRVPNTYFKYWNNNNVKLGVKVEDAPDNAGAKILSVDDGSAADKAGLKKDDIITEINGEKVTNVDEVRSQLMESEDKDTLNVKAKRNNAEMNFDVKITKPVNSADL